MIDQVDWIRLLEQRHALAAEPDEASVERHLAHWRHALEREENLPEAKLDDEMVRLLDLIHHSR